MIHLIKEAALEWVRFCDFQFTAYYSLMLVVSVYPDGCVRYYGSHPIECLETIWIDASCVAEGTRYPNKLSSLELSRIDDLNLRYLIDCL